MVYPPRSNKQLIPVGKVVVYMRSEDEQTSKRDKRFFSEGEPAGR